jgi:hypothetical protein
VPNRLRLVSNDNRSDLIPRAMVAWAILCLLAIVWLLASALFQF